MKTTSCKFRAKYFRFCFQSSTWLNLSLQPKLIKARLTPICKQADAISTGENFIEMIFQLGEQYVLIHILLHIESWLNIERKFCDDSQTTQANDNSIKLLG